MYAMLLIIVSPIIQSSCPPNLYFAVVYHFKFESALLRTLEQCRVKVQGQLA